MQGSQGADYTYLLNVSNPIVIDITLCSANTTYDTKLEIFTADQECNETTTGYYIDDATCEFSSLQSSLLGVSLEAGQYYIVVDGFGGQEGQYEINVTESALEATPPNNISTNILYISSNLLRPPRGTSPFLPPDTYHEPISGAKLPPTGIVIAG